MAIALFPFLPNSSQKIWNQIGLKGNVQNANWDSISELEIKPGHALGDVSPLFTKVEPEDVKKYKKQLGPAESK